MAKATKSIALYALATAIVSGSNFLLTPLLLRALGVSGFEEWSALEPLVLLAIPLAGLGIQVGLINEMRKDSSVAGRLFPLHIITSLAISGLFFTVLALIGWPRWLSLMAASIVMIEGTIAFYIAFWRVTNRPAAYAVMEGMRAFVILSIIAIIALLLASSMSTENYLVVRLFVGFIFLTLGILSTRWKLKPSIDLGRQAVGYGLPIVIASAAVAVFMNFDRYFLLGFAHDANLAGYVAHIKLVQILGAALSPFFVWFAPIAIRRVSENLGNDRFFGQTFYGFVAVDLALSVGLWIGAPAFWLMLFPDIEYDPKLLALNIIGVAVMSCGNPLGIGSLKEGKTNVALAITLIACVAGFGLMFVLGSAWGTIGVASGKVAAMFLYTILFAAHSRYTLKIDYPWASIVILATASILLALLVGNLTATSSPLIGILAASASSLALLASSAAYWRLLLKKQPA